MENQELAPISLIERPLSAQELALTLGMHHVTVLNWARLGKIPCSRLSARKIVFLPSQINRWLTSNYAVTEIASSDELTEGATNCGLRQKPRQTLASELELPEFAGRPGGIVTAMHRRQRYQRGSLTIEKRQNGPDIWVYRWRELRRGGGFIHRKKLIGSNQEYVTKAAALKAVSWLQLEINGNVPAPDRDLTVDEVIAHFETIELAESSGKTRRTKDVYRYQLDNVISPKWGAFRLWEVKPFLVERWLSELPGAPGTRAKSKGVMSVLFQHAMRYEWATNNPIRHVRQSALPQHNQIVLAPVEVSALLSELDDPFRTLIMLAALTGLRRGELFGLKWEDLDFAEREIRIRRSVVDQVEGPPKTLASRSPVPMSSELASTLENWRKRTSFPSGEDWVFASPLALGKRPYWPDAVLKRHVYPAADRARITKRIGWHSFRRTLATLLQSSGASVKTTQELLRHASPGITLGIYAKAITAEKREAQEAITTLFFGNQTAPTKET